MRQFYYVPALVMLVSSFSFGYRFICNGILANGDERIDECGLCDAEHAARWFSPTIEVAVDYSRVPKNISQSDWQ